MTKKISFFCKDESAIKNFPPLPASKIIPEWYKETVPFLPVDQKYVLRSQIGSIKKCIPVLDYLTSGYIIQNVYQFHLVKKQDGIYTGHDSACIKTGFVGAQPHVQAPTEIDGKRYHYIKLHQPWMIKTPPGYSCLFYQPYYFFNKKYEIFPGIVDTDKYTEAVSLIGILHADELTIDPGDPLVLVLPFKRDEWQSEIELTDFNSISRFKYLIMNAWHGTYSKFVHSKKKFV
jgi:hypothetical protein